MKKEPSPTNMPTLLTCISKAKTDGYTYDLEVTESGLHVKDDEHYYSSEQVAINDFYRFEGASDPSENSILYLVETNDGKKGILINAYGAYADPILAAFIEQVEEFSKKSKQV
jgi:hypothetical protein